MFFWTYSCQVVERKMLRFVSQLPAEVVCSSLHGRLFAESSETEPKQRSCRAEFIDVSDTSMLSGCSVRLCRKDFHEIKRQLILELAEFTWTPKTLLALVFGSRCIRKRSLAQSSPSFKGYAGGRFKVDFLPKGNNTLCKQGAWEGIRLLHTLSFLT